MSISEPSPFLSHKNCNYASIFEHKGKQPTSILVQIFYSLGADQAKGALLPLVHGLYQCPECKMLQPATNDDLTPEIKRKMGVG